MANIFLSSFLRPKTIEGWLFWVVAFFVLLFSLLTNQFLTLQNMLDLAEGYAVTGIFALGLFVVLVIGGIDISFAAIASVVQYIIATLFVKFGFDNAALMLIGAILCGICCGFVNATLIYYLRVTSIIITISMQAVLFGLLMWMTEGKNIYTLPDWWVTFLNILPFHVGGEAYQIGLPFLVLIILAILTSLILNKTHLGRHLFATGGNQEAARRIGIRVGVIHFFAYGYLGAMAAIGGMVQVYRVGEVVPRSLVGSELDVLAAVVLGGASLSGGKGSVIGTLMGVFLVAILKNGLNLMGISNYFMSVVIGGVIMAAITVTHYNRRRETDVGFA